MFIFLGFQYLIGKNKLFRSLKLMLNLVTCALVANMLAGQFQPAVLYLGMHWQHVPCCKLLQGDEHNNNKSVSALHHLKINIFFVGTLSRKFTLQCVQKILLSLRLMMLHLKTLIFLPFKVNIVKDLFCLILCCCGLVSKCLGHLRLSRSWAYCQQAFKT